MGKADGFQSFTAIGRVPSAEIIQFDMGNGFRPFRREVEFLPYRPVPVDEVKRYLDLTRAPNWGFTLRRELLRISERDFEIIKRAGEVEHE